MFYLGMILDQKDETDEARHWLDQAARGGNALAMGRYAIFLSEQGDLAGAREWGEKAHAAGDPFISALLPTFSLQQQPTDTPTPIDDRQHRPTPDQIRWTPLEQSCGCVTDWGWDEVHADPVTFINWCLHVLDQPCPWHADDPHAPLEQIRTPLIVGDPDHGPCFYAHGAFGQDIVLGRRLTANLRDLVAQIQDGSTQALLAQIPAAYRDYVAANGDDPLDAWVNQMLTDLILNRGQSLLPDLVRRLEEHREAQP